MPQLDKFMFLDQILFVVFFLLVIYILNVYVFLPKLITILKFRARALKLIKKKQKSLNVFLTICKNEEQFSNNFYYSFFFVIDKNILDIIKNFAYLLQNTSYLILSSTK